VRTQIMLGPQVEDMLNTGSSANWPLRAFELKVL